MNLDLAGKRALVTGSSRGIGKAIAEGLCAEGCRVAINARGADDLARVAATSPMYVPVVADVSTPADAQRLVSATVDVLGGLDILVCSVGSGRSVPPGTETLDEWQRVFELNLWSATNMVEAARAPLVAARGTIVCISSICGQEVVPGAPVTYSAAKAALNAYVRGMARPLGQEGVRINAVAPGNILFEGSVWERKVAADRAGVQLMLERDVALSKLGTPRDVADLVIYLASQRAAFATGGIWTLDGGQVHS